VTAALVQPGVDAVACDRGQRNLPRLVALAGQADGAGTAGDRDVLGVEAGALLLAGPGAHEHRDDGGAG